MLEILDRRALAQEFRIGDDLDLGVRPLLAQDMLDLVAGADRHGRFGDDDRVGIKLRRDLAHRVVDEAQIGMAVAAARRRADRDEHRLGVADARRLDGEFEPALAHIGFDQIGEARLEDRDFAAIERGHLAGILVDAGHLVTEVGKAGAGDEPDISGADHRHAHGVSCSRSHHTWSRPLVQPGLGFLDRRRRMKSARIRRSRRCVSSAIPSADQTTPAPVPHRPSRQAAPITPAPIRRGTWTRTITVA